MEQWTDLEVEQTLEEVRRRSVEYPAFRALALRDAEAAIAEVNPKPLPRGILVQFADNSGSTKTVVLPAPHTRGDELTDEELEAVAGGADIPPTLKVG